MAHVQPLSALRQFRLIAFAEGLSFLVLLFLAMPLKYLAGKPEAVSVVGSIHGLLFLLFIAVLYRTAVECTWPPRRIVVALGAAVVPFGTLAFDRTLKREIQRVSNQESR